MTKKLQELFELPQDDSTVNEDMIEHAEIEIISTDTYNTLEKIENALPQVRGLEASDTEMDSLAQMATDSYKDLMDLGMQVDSRFASEIFNSAGTMLGHAITAKTAKLDKKLKMVQLQLQKAKFDHQVSKETKNDDEEIVEGKGIVLDRNELLKQILNQSKDQKK